MVRGKLNPCHEGSSVSHAWAGPWVPLLVIAAATVAYAGSFDGVFVFDDHRYIINNPRIRDLSAVGTVLSHRRPVVDLSLAINYAVGGLEVRGFHAINLLIHIFAALTLYGLVRRTLLTEGVRKLWASSAPALPQGSFLHSGQTTERRLRPKVATRGSHTSTETALAGVAALIWAVHPLQTQSVTYLIQRSESLMGLFYLLTFYCVIRGAGSRRRRGWHFGACLCCALGMGSKAVMVSAPVLLLLYDRVFLARSFAEVFRRRWGLYIGLTATWAVLVMTDVAPAVLSTSRERATVGFSFKGTTPLAYSLTQPGVILHYLRLSLWPDPLCLDYDWPMAQRVGLVASQAAVMVVLAVLSLWALSRRPWLGFCGAWFFVTLSPTSSFVPLRDAAFEHRMYLPLAGVVVMITVGGFVLLRWFAHAIHAGAWSRRGMVGVVVVAVVSTLGYGTFRRNRVYASELAIWQSVIAHRPNHARAYDNLGRALEAAGEPGDGIGAFRKAVQLNPGNPNAHSNLGAALTQQGHGEEAMLHYRAALRIDPRHANANRNLGVALAAEGRFDEAAAALRKALSANILFAEAHFNLAAVLFEQGRMDEAIDECRKSVKINPNLHEAHFNLGIALKQRGELADAIRSLREAVRLAPSNPRIHFTLARAYAQHGQRAPAIEHYERTLALAPDHPWARQAMDALRPDR